MGGGHERGLGGQAVSGVKSQFCPCNVLVCGLLQVTSGRSASVSSSVKWQSVGRVNELIYVKRLEQCPVHWLERHLEGPARFGDHTAAGEGGWEHEPHFGAVLKVQPRSGLWPW